MGIGSASGEKRAEKAALQAINSPLLEVSINGAKGVLFAVSGGDDITMHEIGEAAKVITESIDKDAKVIFGTIYDDKLKKGELKVTVIATSFPTDMARKTLFSSAPTPSTPKEDNGPVIKKEIYNNTSNVTVNSAPSNNDFLKKIERAPIEEIVIEDEGEDWSAVPAFLRRNKK
jgi:cell division protein FtsZ